MGQGHHSHRLPTTCWKSPFVAGHDCAPGEVMPLYIDHIKRNFGQELHSLLGKTLVCDCAEDELCEADVLAGLVFEATSPNASAPHPRAAGIPPRRVVRGPKRGSLALAALQAPTLAGSSVVRWTQEAVVTTFRKLFPAEWFSGFKFPMIEDLLNQHPFCSYVQWREAQGLEWDGPLNPSGGSGVTRLRQRHTEGKQAGSLNHRAALPPLLPFGLDPDEHFEAACTVGQYPWPTERSPVVDTDLQFAAYMHAREKDSLGSWRRRALGMLRELKRRWAPVTDKLRSIQTDAIARVTTKRDLGLTALLVVMTHLGDTCYPYGLVTGLPAVGTAPCYNILPAQQGSIINLADVVEDTAEHNRAIIAKLRPGLHDEFLLSQSVVDADKGFGTHPMTWSELLRATQGRPFRLIPRCVIVQPSGKKRIIDDAAVGGQSALSSDYNKLVLCSALRPAQHVAAVASWMSQSDWEHHMAHDHFESGGEDWPDAYRQTQCNLQGGEPWLCRHLVA